MGKGSERQGQKYSGRAKLTKSVLDASLSFGQSASKNELHALTAQTHAVLGRSVVSNSLRPRGLQHSRLLCPWGFSRQEHWSGSPCPPPGDLPSPGIEPRSPALQADPLPSEPPGKPIAQTRVWQAFSQRARQYLILALQVLRPLQQLVNWKAAIDYVNKWLWPFSHKTLFIKQVEGQIWFLGCSLPTPRYSV